MRRPEFKQKGVVLLLLLLVFLVGGTSMMLGTFDNRQDIYLRQQSELTNQLQLAKEALLAFAANSSAIYNNMRGPGFFPCPDTDNDAAPNDGCDTGSVNLGRLPQYIETPSGNKVFFNSYYAAVNQQFWYAIAPHYTYSVSAVDDREAVKRTSIESEISASRLTLDGFDNVVALIIAPGDALSIQDRNANSLANNFLEGGNENGGPNFFTTDASNPDAVNDRIIAITHNELMMYIGSRVAIEIKGLLDMYFESASEPQHYPNDVEFSNLLTDHDWLGDMGVYYERWASNTTYTLDSPTEVSLQFDGCVMSFTLKHDGGVTRDGDSC